MQEQANRQKDNFLLDRTGKQKVGKTTFTVSSFLRTGNAPAYLDILNSLVKEEIYIEQTKKHESSY